MPNFVLLNQNTTLLLIKGMEIRQADNDGGIAMGGHHDGGDITAKMDDDLYTDQ